MAVSPSKIRVSITIDQATHSALTKIGKAKDRPVSYIVCQAVSFYLTEHPDSELVQADNQ